MRQRFKNFLLILAAFCLLVIVVPFLLNWFILSERRFDIVGDSKDWLQFWAVYLGAVGTLLMTYATFRTLRSNQKQMETVIESEGAQLVFSLYSDYEYVLLKVTNVGRSVAKNIRLSIPNRLDIIEKNVGMPFGEGLIKHLGNLNPIPLLLPNQSDYIPLYMYRAVSSSIKETDGVKTVEMFGDSYSPESITEIGQFFKNETFTVTGSFTNFLNQHHSVTQNVDNTYNVTLSEENTTMQRMFRELNKNLAGIKNEIHALDTSKLKDIDVALDKVKSELHSVSECLKKIEGKIKK